MYIYYFHNQIFFGNNICYWKATNLSSFILHMCTQTNLPVFYWNVTGASVTPAVVYTFTFYISFFMRGTIISSQKHSSFYFQMPWIWSFKQANKRITHVSVSFALAESYGKNEKITSQWSLMGFFKANLDRKTKKAWSESNISSIEMEYLILCQWKLDLISVVISFLNLLLGRPKALWQCSTEWAGELARLTLNTWVTSPWVTLFLLYGHFVSECDAKTFLFI